MIKKKCDTADGTVTALRGGCCCGGPGDSPRIQCHVNKRKMNQRDRAKGFQRFPPSPLDPAGSPSPQAPGEGPCSAGLRSCLPSSLIVGIAEPSALFSRRRGGREEARGKGQQSHLCRAGFTLPSVQSQEGWIDVSFSFKKYSRKNVSKKDLSWSLSGPKGKGDTTCS